MLIGLVSRRTPVLSRAGCALAAASESERGPPGTPDAEGDDRLLGALHAGVAPSPRCSDRNPGE